MPRVFRTSDSWPEDLSGPPKALVARPRYCESKTGETDPRRQIHLRSQNPFPPTRGREREPGPRRMLETTQSKPGCTRAESALSCVLLAAGRQRNLSGCGEA